MRGFEILDHPADIGIEIFGSTKEELFKNAAYGISSLIIEEEMLEVRHGEPLLKEEINLKGENYEELLTLWLDEIIYLFDTKGFLIKNVKEIKITDKFLQAWLMGEKFNKDKHTIKLYLKAVTYHQLEIKQLDDGSWRAKVYFDV